jgi:DNA-binding NarL/FixJ family response regulator
MRNFGLTGREQEVLERVKQGEFVEEIAGALKISHSTVRAHYTNIHGKLGLDQGAGILQGLARKAFRERAAASGKEPGAGLDTDTVDKARERF